MNDHQNEPKDIAASRALALRQHRETILSLPADQALDKIHEAEHPAALVHSFPEEDLYFLIHDLGPEDALSLLALASNKQREYLIDVTAWHRDRLQLQTLTKWLHLMLSADPHQVLFWLNTEQTDLLTLILFRNIEVAFREHDQDPSIFGNDFFTFDDIYYIRILDKSVFSENGERTKTTESETDDKQRRFFLKKLLSLLANEDHFRFQQILHAAANVLPAELEEEAYRLRNVRLAEKGFLAFDEAVGIYQPLKMDALKTQRAKSFGTAALQDNDTAVPYYPVSMLPKKSVFTEALQAIDSSLVIQQIQSEFASLCNQIISADQTSITDKNQLTPIVKKACGYLNIGLDLSSPGKARAEKADRRHTMATTIQRIPLAKIFQLGYSQALRLKWQAQRWQKTAWFQKSGLPLAFWDEAWVGVLGGLLLEKPLCYDNYRTGETLYRNFYSLQDILEAQKVLDQLMAMDRLLSQMAPDCRQSKQHFLTYKSLVLTLFARHHIGIPLKPLAPLTLEEFKAFFLQLFDHEEQPPPPHHPKHKGSFSRMAFGAIENTTCRHHRKAWPCLGPSV